MTIKPSSSPQSDNLIEDIFAVKTNTWDQSTIRTKSVTGNRVNKCIIGDIEPDFIESGEAALAALAKKEPEKQKFHWDHKQAEELINTIHTKPDTIIIKTEDMADILEQELPDFFQLIFDKRFPLDQTGVIYQELVDCFHDQKTDSDSDRWYRFGRMRLWLIQRIGIVPNTIENSEKMMELKKELRELKNWGNNWFSFMRIKSLQEKISSIRKQETEEEFERLKKKYVTNNMVIYADFGTLDLDLERAVSLKHQKKSMHIPLQSAFIFMPEEKTPSFSVENMGTKEAMAYENEFRKRLRKLYDALIIEGKRAGEWKILQEQKELIESREGYLANSEMVLNKINEVQFFMDLDHPDEWKTPHAKRIFENISPERKAELVEEWKKIVEERDSMLAEDSEPWEKDEEELLM